MSAEGVVPAAPPQRAVERPGGLARRLAVAPIELYRRWISPGLPRRCKYEPTCARYAVESITRYGILKGLVLATWRLLRCNPWSHGGFDPVEAQRLFRTAPAAGATSENR